MGEKCSLTHLTVTSNKKILFIYKHMQHTMAHPHRESPRLEGEMSYNVLLSFDCSCYKSDCTYPVSASAVCGYNGSHRKLPHSADAMFVTIVCADNE